VEARVVQTDRQHRAVGWYAEITRHVAACACDFCAAARNGRRDVYLGYHLRDAIVEADRYVSEHEET
jgi:hypothetical protein